jgi:hypothetical protein
MLVRGPSYETMVELASFSKLRCKIGPDVTRSDLRRLFVQTHWFEPHSLLQKVVVSLYPDASDFAYVLKSI